MLGAYVHPEGERQRGVRDTEDKTIVLSSLGLEPEFLGSLTRPQPTIPKWLDV